MNTEGFLFQALIYLAAAVVAVPIAKRLGLGSVLGYLVAGIIIGPFVLGFIGEEGQDVLHFAEFGVVLMLFVIGLELKPALLWKLRMPILGMGGLQVVGTTGLGFGVATLLGLQWQSALTVGLTLALSSTAIVLQSLSEKGLLTEELWGPEHALHPSLSRHSGHPHARGSPATRPPRGIRGAPR